MSAQVPQVEAIFANSKRTQMEISKALANLGFGAWNELEPGKISDGSTGVFRVCLRLELGHRFKIKFLLDVSGFISMPFINLNNPNGSTITYINITNVGKHKFVFFYD
jgi:hypothetical protein